MAVVAFEAEAPEYEHVQKVDLSVRLSDSVSISIENI